MAKDTETGIRERGCTQRNSDLCSSGEPDERGCTQGKSDLCSSPECNEDTESVQRKSGCSQGKSDLCSSGYCSNWMELREEIKQQFKLSWALTLINVGYLGMPMVAISFAGRLSKQQLAVVSLSNSIANILGIILFNGIVAAAETAFTQTFGSKHSAQLGVQVQKAVWTTTLIALVISAILSNMNHILPLLGQEEHLAKLSGDYIFRWIPSLFFFYLYMISSRYAESQNVIKPFILVGFTALGISALANYILLDIFHLELLGSAMSQNIGYFSLMSLSLIYIIVSRMYKDTWSGFDTASFLKWGDFSKLMAHSAFMAIAEWVSFESGILLAGKLGETELSSQALAYQWAYIFHCLPSGIGRAASIRIGQMLGAGKTAEAVVANKVAFIMAGISAAAECLLAIALKEQLPRVITNNREVIAMTSSIMPVIGVYLLMNNMMTVSRYVLRGCGKQSKGSLINFISYFVIGLPIGITLMFETELRLFGFWIGLIAGMGVGITSLAVYLLFIGDWNTFTEEALTRAGSVKKAQTEDTESHILTSTDTHDYTSISELFQESKKTISQSIIWRRIATCCLCVVIFIAGIICRFIF